MVEEATYGVENWQKHAESVDIPKEQILNLQIYHSFFRRSARFPKHHSPRPKMKVAKP
jgi:hypothetical protein